MAKRTWEPENDEQQAAYLLAIVINTVNPAIGPARAYDLILDFLYGDGTKDNAVALGQALRGTATTTRRDN